jgi:CRISPR-associated protein Cas5d
LKHISKGGSLLPIKVEVWGDYACFSRPEFKVERVSYDVNNSQRRQGAD